MSVIKVSTKAAVEVLPFHQDVYRIAMTGIRATQTVAQKMAALVTSRYADKAPTFEQYKADLRALDQIAKDRKLVDGQWLRRPYGAALKQLYGALPVSQAPEAVAKRQQREQRDALVKKAIADAKATGTKDAPAPVGAPAGQTQERVPSPAEQLEQLVSRVGVYETLYACLRILESDESTKAQAVHMRKMADKAHDLQVAADKKAREAAVKPA